MKKALILLVLCLLQLLVGCAAPTALPGDAAGEVIQDPPLAEVALLPSEEVILPLPSPSPQTAVALSQPLPAAKTASVSAPPPTASPTAQPFLLCSPLAEHPFEELPEIISEPYHPPPPGREERHHGVDFSYYRRGERLSIHGSPVQAVLPGHAALSLEDSFPYGNVLIGETPGDSLPVELASSLGVGPGESLYLLYAHLDQAPQAALGDALEACRLLGAVGKSGNAGVAHLHLEARIGPAGQQFSSMGFYDVQASEDEKENYLRWRISGDFRHFDPMLLLAGSGSE